jgi:hypothetical protein
MSKPLEERLRDSKTNLDKVDTSLFGAAQIPAEVATYFGTITVFAGEIEHWIEMLTARSAARRLLTNLEAQVDTQDTVPFGATRAKFQHVRLIGVQAYLAMKWSLIDLLSGMVGRVLCTPDAGFDSSRPAQLVAEFVQKDRKKHSAGVLCKSIQQTFGWPIAISYALRNHFIHDGGQRDNINLFDGPTAASGFMISEDGWKRIEQRAKDYGTETNHHRMGQAWPTSPRDDLRVILDTCERETDDAIGVLVGSACQTLLAHVGFMLGED